MASRHLWLRRVEAVKRQAAGNTIQAASGLEAASATAAANSSLYLGVGLGVGGALLICCILVIVQIARKRASHKRALAELEQGHTIETAQAQGAHGLVPRPVSFARAGRLVSTNDKRGWGALGSNEEVNEPDSAGRPIRKRRSYISLPKRIKQQGIPLRRLKHLSAIIESPRSRSANSPTQDAQDLPVLPPSKKRSRGATGSAGTGEHRASHEDDVFAGPSSPKPSVLPSFAIRSPGRYGVSFVEDSPNKTAKRSHSVSALVEPAPDCDVFGPRATEGRPPMHARSISLGASRCPTRPPTGPVPPLPVIAPHNAQVSGYRNGFCLSRMSSSSTESANSSVLVTSPILRAPAEDLSSPSLEQMVAEDDAASLKTVSHKQWQNPLVAGPRPIPDTSPTVPASAMGHQHKQSVRGNIACYSVESQLSRQLSTTSVASSIDSDRAKRLSIPKLGTADRVSIRSVSSVGSLRSESGVKKIITPRRVSRCSTTVSENGSPAEKQKSSVLRDISGNAYTPSRQASNATQNSSRSSNGNPFQWDSAPLQKPSALKGSPNARKGHRRQNCVRISTLTPQILGPPPSRPTSPSIMHGIEEEPVDFDRENYLGGLPFVSSQSHSHFARPSDATAFAPHLRISTLRASLTSTSPTLNTWTSFQEPGLPSQHSDSMLSVSASPGTVGTRSASRQSGQSSNFSIPSFPSPSKTTVTAVQRHQPVPEFCVTRPSTDERQSFDFGWERGNPPTFDQQLLENDELPSSPPLPVAKEDEYDPACLMLVIPKRDGSQEYDPASPAFVATGSPLQSSPYASTVMFSDDTARYSRPVSYSEEFQPESPPCSPKSMPKDFGTFVPSSPSPEEHSNSSTPRAHETLTSANASTIMARIRTHSHKVDFPGAPILPPPIDDNPVPFFPLSTTRARSAPTTMHLHPHRTAPPPPLPTNSAAGSVPTSLLPGPHSPTNPLPIPSPTTTSPNRTTTSPIGPRQQPARSISKQITALRRMNSEIDTSTSTQTRRYIHGLSREPAPLLPYIGSSSPNPSESCNDLFDFDFNPDARGGAAAEERGFGAGFGGVYECGHEDEEASPTSALDNIDMSDIERRLEGALAGFDVPVSSRRSQEQDRDREARGCEERALEGDCDPRALEEGSRSSSPCGQDQDQDSHSRSSSVWEDDEKFWARTSLSTIPGSSPSDAEKLRVVKTPRMYAPVAGLGAARRSYMRTPSMVATPGVVATPGSLYDGDGFLKSPG